LPPPLGGGKRIEEGALAKLMKNKIPSRFSFSAKAIRNFPFIFLAQSHEAI
jgi:hypothetical protein